MPSLSEQITASNQKIGNVLQNRDQTLQQHDHAMATSWGVYSHRIKELESINPNDPRIGQIKQEQWADFQQRQTARAQTDQYYIQEIQKEEIINNALIAKQQQELSPQELGKVQKHDERPTSSDFSHQDAMNEKLSPVVDMEKVAQNRRKQEELEKLKRQRDKQRETEKNRERS